MAGDGPVRLVGSGAPIVLDAIAGRGTRSCSTARVPDPVWLARLGAASPIPERLPRPVYLQARRRPSPASPAQIARV